jgi:hypothetical protein
MLKYYIKDILNVTRIKPKVMKLTYAIKISFNINGTLTIHLYLPFFGTKVSMNSKH